VGWRDLYMCKHNHVLALSMNVINISVHTYQARVSMLTLWVVHQ
jgi:hypothetical protein